MKKVTNQQSRKTVRRLNSLEVKQKSLLSSQAIQTCKTIHHKYSKCQTKAKRLKQLIKIQLRQTQYLRARLRIRSTTSQTSLQNMHLQLGWATCRETLLSKTKTASSCIRTLKRVPTPTCLEFAMVTDTLERRQAILSSKSCQGSSKPALNMKRHSERQTSS